MSVFMQIEGITGVATEEHHVGWIPINSFQMGFGRGISTPTGSGADRESSMVSVSEAVVTKEQDASVIDVLSWGLGGDEVKTVIVDFCATGKEDTPYLKYELTNTLLSGYSLSSGGDRPLESISLNFTKFVCTSTSAKADNTDASPAHVGWDIGTQAKV